MKKVYIAGHKGLVGSSIDRILTKNGYTNIIRKTHSELDLRNREEVFNFFKKEKPDWVFLSAAKVGGIYANNTYPVDFLLYNLQIQNNIIEASYENNVEKLMFLGSSCIYPRECPQPIKEEYLLSGYLESTNRPYALAKITGIELCDAYNRQYNTNYIAVMPCNLYGINDNYHEENAHVIPMLIRRFHEAKINNLKETVIWGSGTPLRETGRSFPSPCECNGLSTPRSFRSAAPVPGASPQYSSPGYNGSFPAEPHPPRLNAPRSPSRRRVPSWPFRTEASHSPSSSGFSLPCFPPCPECLPRTSPVPAAAAVHPAHSAPAAPFPFPCCRASARKNRKCRRSPSADCKRHPRRCFV